jgi:hypothetical protein
MKTKPARGVEASDTKVHRKWPLEGLKACLRTSPSFDAKTKLLSFAHGNNLDSTFMVIRRNVGALR